MLSWALLMLTLMSAWKSLHAHSPHLHHACDILPSPGALQEKAQTLSCCNLTPEYAQLVTTNHLETNLHAVRLCWEAGTRWLLGLCKASMPLGRPQPHVA